MPSVNAIGKVRFNSARPQRVHLLPGPAPAADLLCLEAGQELDLAPDDRVLYVVTGTAELRRPAAEQLPAGHVISTEGSGVLANPTQQRLVCLVFKAE